MCGNQILSESWDSTLRCNPQRLVGSFLWISSKTDELKNDNVWNMIEYK